MRCFPLSVATRKTTGCVWARPPPSVHSRARWHPGQTRSSDQMVKPINSGGESIFPDEVEAVLRYHPDISNAAVVGVPDRLMGVTHGGSVEPAAGRPGPT